jgi:hypothetical protein
LKITKTGKFFGRLSFWDKINSFELIIEIDDKKLSHIYYGE